MFYLSYRNTVVNNNEFNFSNQSITIELKYVCFFFKIANLKVKRFVKLDFPF